MRRFNIFMHCRTDGVTRVVRLHEQDAWNGTYVRFDELPEEKEMIHAASNTPGCFREILGLRVVAVLHNALPVNRKDLQNGCVTLVLEDGTGLTFNTNSGSYWREDETDIGLAVAQKKDALERARAELEEAMKVDGVLKAIAHGRLRS